MITLTSEEAQQVLDALNEGLTSKEYRALVETLRARLAQPEAEPNVYGDGNVYRGQRSKDSETKTIHYTAPPQRVYCSCGDGIVADDGALCGTCVSLKDAVKQEPVAWHEPGSYSNVTVYKKWAEENGWLPLYKEKNT